MHVFIENKVSKFMCWGEELVETGIQYDTIIIFQAGGQYVDLNTQSRSTRV